MKILVVDDNKTMRNIIGNTLKEEGFDIVYAKTGKEAILRLMKEENIDLVTLDVEMPSMDGFKTLHNIRNNEKFKDKINSNIPVIFITGSDTLKDRIKGFQLGITDFISKLDLEKHLVSRVFRILQPEKEFCDTHILVIDDSAVAREVSIKILAQISNNIDQASSGEEAIKLLKDNPNKYDLILSDYIMEDTNGYELTKYIRQSLNQVEIPIIILTAYSERSKLIDFFKAGITDYIIKPFFKEEFVARIKSHLQRYIDHKKIVKHIEEKQKAFDKIEKLKDEIFEVEKKNVSLAMAVTANHEINQPLMIIKGNLEILFTKLSDLRTTDTVKYFNKISQSVQRISKILDKMKSIEDVSLKNYTEKTQMLDLE